MNATKIWRENMDSIYVARDRDWGQAFAIAVMNFLLP